MRCGPIAIDPAPGMIPSGARMPLRRFRAIAVHRAGMIRDGAAPAPRPHARTVG
jgi:hypothetical protein